MKRTLRSAASISDAENGSQEKAPKQMSLNAKSQRGHKNKIPKENKENATTTGKHTKRTVRKDAVQPLQAKNSIEVEQKNDKSSLSSSLTHTNKPEKPTQKVDTPLKTLPIVDAVQKSIPTVDTVPADAVSKPRNRTKLVDDKKRAEVKIVTESDTTALKEQPLTTPAPDKPVVASSVTLRNKKQTKDVQHTTKKQAKRQVNGERSSAQEKPTTDDPTEERSQIVDEPEVVEKSTTIKPVVPFTTRTRAAAKSSLRETRSRRTQPNAIKTPAKKPTAVKTRSEKPATITTRPKKPTTVTTSSEKPTTVTTKSEKPTTVTTKSEKPAAVTTRSEKKNSKAKTPHASNVEVEQKQKEKKSSKPTSRPKIIEESKPIAQPDTNSTQFVTIRNNRKDTVKPAVVNDDKTRNVTTRKRANIRSESKDVSKNIDTVSGITKRKRAESVNRDAKEMDTKSKADDIISPPKRRRITKKEDPKIVGAAIKQQQPELLVNRSNASDSSDRSNASVVPIYKRINTINNNTVDSVFDFESNSQENTLNQDEETQQLLAKLVRDKRVRVAKRKGSQKKGGVTKAKVTNVSRSKQIEKLRSDLKELNELKARATNEPVSNVTKRRVISKPQTKSLRMENNTKSTRKPVCVVDLVGEKNFSVEHSSKNSPANNGNLSNKQSAPVDDIELDDMVDNMVDDMVDDMPFNDGYSDVEDNAIIPKPSNPLKLKVTESTETPPRHIPATTYTGPRKDITTLHQSTPVQTVNAGNASPWRLNPDGVKPANVFSRYSEFEKSPIKSGDVTKVPAEVKSPTKKPRPPVTKKSVAVNLPEVEKPKTLDNDIRNGFGFSDDEDDGDDPQGPSLPALNLSSVAPHKNASPKKPVTAVPKKSTKDSKKTTASSSKFFKMPNVFNKIREKVMLLKNTQASVSSSSSSSMSKPTTQGKISTHFGNASKPTSSRGVKTTENTSKYDGSRLFEPSATEATIFYADKDGPSLFETTWLTGNDKPHRSYSRVTKREPKRQNDYRSVLTLTDDESECGESVVQKRTKRTKPKEDKFQAELRQFEENMNSDFMDVDKFELIKEKSVCSSSVM